MTTIEQLRVIARGTGRRPLKPLWLVCFRCGDVFMAARICRDCRGCVKANLNTFGSSHPLSEISGH